MTRNPPKVAVSELHRPILALLSIIFFLRIVAQYLQSNRGFSGLPAFELWHSETMPYPVLLCLQIVILGAMVLTVWKKSAGNSQRLGIALKVLAMIYALAMLARMTIGLLSLSSATWFDGAVSTAFHFVLAAFLLTLGSMLTANEPSKRWE